MNTPFLLSILLLFFPQAESSKTQIPTAEDGPFYQVRYCEILVARFSGVGKIKADVYNSLGCNACPQEAWEAIDYKAIAKEYDALKAQPNGPRYWVLDNMINNNPKPFDACAHTFGGIDMTLMASVEIAGRRGKNNAYKPNRVSRNTTFHFNQGRQVYLLKSPENQCYIMQSFTQAVDKKLRIKDLAGLGERLTLPKGWSFQTKVLAESFQLTTKDGIAEVVTDDLKNTYQLMHEGCW
ncbi:MAG: hypothetical protein AAF206_03600 [Bacteroidota bacterium]